MESKMKRASRGENEEKVDRISALPDCLLLCIMTFMETKEAIQTCILSKRWKELWKCLPALIAINHQFLSSDKFLPEFLFHRDDSISLLIVFLVHYGNFDSKTLGDLITYAKSHAVKSFFFHAHIQSEIQRNIVEFCPIFSCHSLTYLNISVENHGELIKLPETLDLPELVKCHLRYVEFTSSNDKSAKPFSVCKKLSALAIYNSKLSNANVLCVSSDKLSKLVIKFGEFISDSFKVQVHAPNLNFFALVGPLTPINSHQLSEHSLNSLKDLVIHISFTESIREVLETLRNWLKMVSNLNSLTIAWQTLEVISLTQSVRFRNLKSLIIYCEPETVIPDEVLKNILQYSPLAEVTIIRGGRYTLRL